MNQSLNLEIFSVLLERCQNIDFICLNAIFNKEIAKDINMRVKTIWAMLEFIQTKSPTQFEEGLIYWLLNLLIDLENIIFSITDQSLLLNAWNGITFKTNILELMDQITGIMIDLRVPNLILVNTNSLILQEAIERMLFQLKDIFRTLKNLIDINKPIIFQQLCQILDCKEENIKKSYNFIQYELKQNECMVQENIEGSADFLEKNNVFFMDIGANRFWNKYFSNQIYSFWFNFSKAFKLEYLDSVSLKQLTSILEIIRSKVDPGYTGIVTIEKCNSFFIEVWNKLSKEIFATNLKPIGRKNVSLTLRITSTANQELKIGKTFIIQSQGYSQSHFARYDGITILGRKHGSVDLFINDSSISAIHGIISYHPNSGFIYTDLGSSAGSYIVIEEPLQLHEGILLQIASSHIIHIKKVINKDNKSDYPENSMDMGKSFFPTFPGAPVIKTPIFSLSS